MGCAGWEDPEVDADDVATGGKIVNIELAVFIGQR
jgi:hypothetical protein